MRDVLPPLSVTLPPPSSTVSFVNVICEVTVIVTGALPQLKTIVPPPVAACCSAAAVQLAAVPSPMTAVGDETSYRAGASHTALGNPASPEPPPPPSSSPPPPPPPHAAASTHASA